MPRANCNNNNNNKSWKHINIHCGHCENLTNVNRTSPIQCRETNNIRWNLQNKPTSKRKTVCTNKNKNKAREHTHSHQPPIVHSINRFAFENQKNIQMNDWDQKKTRPQSIKEKNTKWHHWTDNLHEGKSHAAFQHIIFLHLSEGWPQNECVPGKQ